MADVAVRFTVQNAEAVRQALAALGKDGAAALKQLEAGTAAPNAGLNAVSTLVDAAKSRFMGLATSIGPAGQALIQLGPAGLAAAAALGLVAGAFTAAMERANQVAEWARKVREAAETAGVTVEQFQALAQAGQRVGMDLDQTSQFMDRLTLSVEELRQGGGRLFETLARMDAGLVREVAAARTTAEAINVLANAYARLDSQGQRNAFATALGGRGNVGAGQLLEQIAGAGGFQAMEDGARRAGRVIEGEVIERQVRLRRETEELERAATKAWDKFWGFDALAAQREWAALWKGVADSAVAFAQAIRDMPGTSVDDLSTGPGGQLMLGPQRRRPLPPGTTDLATQFTPAPAVVDPWAATVTRDTAATELALMRRWTAVLGDALTLTEQRELRELELGAALAENRITQDQYNRALGAFSRAQEAAIVASRQRVGIAREDEILASRLRELQDLRAKGVIRTAEEMAAAERLVRREVIETANALAVRNSLTPGLTRLSIDAADLTKTLDQGLTGALRGATSTMLEMLKGTKSLSQGFEELASRILDAITEALILKSIVGPLSSGISAGISTLFTPSAMGNVFAGGRLQAFRMGGVVHRPSIFAMANGGVGIMSENEPEAVMPLRRMGSGRLGVEAIGGGSNVQVNIINNHSGARVQQREESDGRGGRKITAVIEEMVASTMARPGSRVPGALFAGQGMSRL